MNSKRIDVAVVVVLGIVCACIGSALAQPCDWLPGEGIPGVDGVVYATATWDPDGAGPEPELLVIGGEFSIAGDVVASNIAAWDGTRWHALGAGMNKPVSCLTVFNGELIAAGRFTLAGGVSSQYIARWDGTNWQPLGDGMDHYVHALAVYDGELIAAGFFTVAGGVTCNHVARWDGNTWQPLGLGTRGSTLSLSVYGGALIAGGTFRFAGPSVPCNYVARWDGSQWQPLGTGMGGSFSGGPFVSALTVYNGELVAGGRFASAGGQNCSFVARWNGSVWQPLGTGMDGSADPNVYALAVSGAELIAGGVFTVAGGVTCNYIARWDGSNWWRMGSGVSGASTYPAPVQSLTTYNGDLIVGGNFSSASGVLCRNLACWNGSSWKSLGTGIGGESNPYMHALTILDNELIAGGSFTTVGGVACNYIARRALGPSGHWQPLGTGMGGGYYPYVYALMVYNGELIAGGEFTTAGGVTCNRIARWNPAAPGQWEPLGSGMNNTVCSLAVFNDELIAGGFFTAAGGVPCQYVARWDGSTWQPVGLGLDGDVYALSVADGQLFAGGRCSLPGDEDRGYVARWDGSTWQTLGSQLSGGSTPRVLALTVYRGEVIAGGSFTTAGGVPCNYIARWNGSAWQPLGTGMSGGVPPFYGPYVYTLSVHNGELIVGGQFTTAGGVACNLIARWNGATWRPLGSGMSAWYIAPGPQVDALTVYNGELIAGGAFTIAGNHSSMCWARWACTVCRGDLNCDGVVSFDDINPFVLALSNWTEWRYTYTGCPERNADINGDGQYGGLYGFGDINPFVELLAGAGGYPIPCP